MRGIALVVIFGALASCTTAPEPVTRTAAKQREFEQLIAGKVPGPPMHCLQSFEMNDMVPIDESTVAYRSVGRVYVNAMQGACGGLTRDAVMVTHTFGSETCRGDIVRMVDPSSHMTTGSCAFGDFIPYSRPR